MKKLFIFVIIGWMSVVSVRAQVVAFNGGYAFQMNSGFRPNRTSFAINYMENHGVFGFGTKFPSSKDKRFELDLHGGAGFYWDYFMLSPQVEVAYNTGGKSVDESENKTTSGISIGAGLLASYKIVGLLGVWTKVDWMSPVGFDPLKVGPGGIVTLSFGLTMFWFR